MIDPATLHQGDSVLVHAIVDRVTGSGLSAHVGNGFVSLAPCDVVPVDGPPRVVCFRADSTRTPCIVLHEHGEWLWIAAGDAAPVSAKRLWVQDVTPTQETSA